MSAMKILNLLVWGSWGIAIGVISSTRLQPELFPQLPSFQIVQIPRFEGAVFVRRTVSGPTPTGCGRGGGSHYTYPELAGKTSIL